MKFSSSLEFNVVSEWREHYLDYASLKKLLYTLEKHRAGQFTDHESPLLGSDSSETAEAVFVKALDKEAEKINSFFLSIEGQILQDDQLSLKDVEQAYNEAQDSSSDDGESRGHSHHDDQHSSSDEEIPLQHATSRPRSSSTGCLAQQTNKLTRQQIAAKRLLIIDWVSLNELQSYIDMNRTGFRKILKKADKILGTSLLSSYRESHLEGLHVFTSKTTDEIRDRKEKVVDAYARYYCVDQQHNTALSALKGYLKEHVTWERNTIWRDMISMQRQTQAMSRATAEPGKESEQKVDKFFGITVGGILGAYAGSAQILVIALIGGLLLQYPLFSKPEQSSCFALVAVASLLWASESIPLFVTSLLIPALVVMMRIPLTTHGDRMTPKEASDFVFSKMWSPVITVLLGGFTLAAALSKYNIAKMASTFILARSGSNPRVLTLVLMLIAAFMCMWISNVAAPVLLFSVAQPLLRTLPDGEPFGRGIILGIALASNIGGMLSPIASPQNIIALQNMEPAPSWTEWFVVALPTGLVSLLFVWAVISLTFPPSKNMKSIAHIRGSAGQLTGTHYYILVITGITIALWCVAHQLEPYVGDMGILALFPIVTLFGSGILTAADFNNFLWTIVALAMGGITLGKAVESCGLLHTVAVALQAQVQHLGIFQICAIFGLVILVIASFISHTVAALIILPLVKSIGEQMDSPHPRILVMVSALLCSVAMALPTSGFPNVAAVCQTNEFGQPYLTVGDFISRGVPASFICYIIVVTVGYAIMQLVDF